MIDIVERLRKREMLAKIGQDKPEIYRDAADEIERLRNALTRERTHWVEAMDKVFTQEQSDLYKAIWDKKNELDKNND